MGRECNTDALKSARAEGVTSRMEREMEAYAIRKKWPTNGHQQKEQQRRMAKNTGLRVEIKQGRSAEAPEWKANLKYAAGILSVQVRVKVERLRKSPAINKRRQGRNAKMAPTTDRMGDKKTRRRPGTAGRDRVKEPARPVGMRATGMFERSETSVSCDGTSKENSNVILLRA